MSNHESLNFANKVLRKQKRCQHIIEKETGIITSFSPTKNIVICNAGLVNGLTEETIFNAFHSFGAIERIVLLPGKSSAFVCFLNELPAELAYNSLNGKLNIGQDQKPIYLLFSNQVPETENISNLIPPGLLILPNFVSENEEKILLNCITWNDSTSSSNLRHRKVTHYGYEFRYDINNVDKNCPLSYQIPEECKNILNRFVIQNNEFTHFHPDQLTVNQYQPGQGIPPHVDTHSAFEDPILSLSLGSPVNMEFKNKDGRQFIALLPRRSLLVMSQESRYAWSHGITPRKLDITPTKNGLTVQERGVRTSFTFRKVRSGDCNCEYHDNCDSYAKNQSKIEDTIAEKLESTHVHQVYEEIASHFSDTRHKAWPNVLDFINSLSIGSILIDVGCGNGKYLGHNPNLFEIGCDRSYNLIEICNKRGFQVFNCNCLNIPLKENSADGIISIAVIHHLANEERRQRAIEEIARILRIGGKALIYVWAKDQKKENKSSYLKQDRKNRKKDAEAKSSHSEVVTLENLTSLPVHVNRTQFQHQDVLVPWKLKNKKETKESEEFLRFYHVFEEGELQLLCDKILNLSVVKSFYDQGNWCVIIQKQNRE